MKSPVVFNDLNPLDSNLCGMALTGFEENTDAVYNNIAHYEGVPLASLPIFGEDTEITRHRMKSNLNGFFERTNSYGVLSASDTFLNKDLDSNTAHELYTRGGSFKVYSTETLIYYITGRLVFLEEMLDTRYSAIGCHTTKGYGKYSSVDIFEEEGNHIGILNPNGELIRPIPLTMAVELGLPKTAYVTKDGRVKAPYSPKLFKACGVGFETVAHPVGIM